jgi:hypothetical protein
MLHSPGNANDSDGQKKTEDDMKQGNPQACDQEPYYIQKAVEATWEFPFIHMESAAKGPQAQGTDFDQLESEWYTDDSHHHGQTSEKITDGSGQTAEKKPDQVAKEIHRADGISVSKYIKKECPAAGGAPSKRIFF